MRASTLILAFFVLLFVLHQDFWWRDDPRLVLGILPVSLAYHVFWTLLVAFGWWLVTRFCWPHELDEESMGTQPPPVALSNATEGGRAPGGVTPAPTAGAATDSIAERPPR